jgi:hypothetical protein
MSNAKLYLTKRGDIYYLGERISENKVRWQTTKCRRKSDALHFLKSYQDKGSPVVTARPIGLALCPRRHREAGWDRPASAEFSPSLPPWYRLMIELSIFKSHNDSI